MRARTHSYILSHTYIQRIICECVYVFYVYSKSPPSYLLAYVGGQGSIICNIDHKTIYGKDILLLLYVYIYIYVIIVRTLLTNNLNTHAVWSSDFIATMGNMLRQRNKYLFVFFSYSFYSVYMHLLYIVYKSRVFINIEFAHTRWYNLLYRRVKPAHALQLNLDHVRSSTSLGFNFKCVRIWHTDNQLVYYGS